ncbi:CP family cyanate transporter-like MFS transporter [Glaciihabitans tibetensis]|uniref:CP family cyanate transporter-like MFS transporter n=1 Tax=Glaciihabitans tibetensis TaxID=1266600 RepID=A0A2T0VHG2_9MICO|nr:MFS transporter [Glaciihabitans tibetensis]PRY69654.1 CP family cyanate transporter-like MFS transporter [Glaciihabitans tibetensis]
MQKPTPARLWAGRTLALAGILLVALNLRTAVASLSPITDQIAADIPLSSVALGVLGALPPVAFALSGILAPLLARSLGLEWSMVLVAGAMVAGHVLRGFSNSFVALLIGSIVVLAGMGFGNILLPPVVKKYFPDRVGLLTTAYATVMSFSASVPALIAAPVADSAGWRASFGVWAVLALASLVPWLLLLARDRRQRRAPHAAEIPGDLRGAGADGPEPALFRRMLRSRVAWAIGLTFAVSSLNAYALFAWLPSMLTDIAGLDAVAAGSMLAVYAIMGLPAALIVPILAVRMRNVGLLVHLGVVCFVAGYLGLLFAPTLAPLLWVILAGLGPLVFPVCLVLINLRTRSQHTSTALSGVVQTIGYTIGAFGPLVVGVLHDQTGAWTVPLIFLLATALVAAISGAMLARPRFVEDDLADVLRRRAPAR